MDAQGHVVFNFQAFLFQDLAFIGQRWVLSGGQPCLPFESLSALGCEVGREGWASRCGREGWELLEEHLGGISCAFKKSYPFWTCLWMQLARSQDRF